MVKAAGRLIANGELPKNPGNAFARAMGGLLIGGGLGVALGLLNGVSRLSEAATDSTLQMLRIIPHLALILLVILWFGIGETARLFLVSLGIFFLVYLNTLHGIRSVDPQLIEMGRVHGMSNAQLFRRVLLPGALPSIFVGLRYVLGIMWRTLIVAETIAANSGIGLMAMKARQFLQVDMVVLPILIYAMLGKLADRVPLIEKCRIGLDLPVGGAWPGNPEDPAQVAVRVAVLDAIMARGGGTDRAALPAAARASIDTAGLSPCARPGAMRKWHSGLRTWAWPPGHLHQMVETC